MYRRILIVASDGAVARSAIDEGLALAKSQAAEVLFFHVLPNYVVPMSDMPPMAVLGPEQYRKAVERSARRILANATESAGLSGVPCRSATGSGLDEAQCIARAATEHQCQLIVIGSHGRSAIQRLVFGSVVTRLITLARVPMLVCKRAETQRPRPARVVAVPTAARAPTPARARAPARAQARTARAGG